MNERETEATYKYTINTSRTSIIKSSRPMTSDERWYIEQEKHGATVLDHTSLESEDDMMSYNSINDFMKNELGGALRKGCLLEQKHIYDKYIEWEEEIKESFLYYDKKPYYYEEMVRQLKNGEHYAHPIFKGADLKDFEAYEEIKKTRISYIGRLKRNAFHYRKKREWENDSPPSEETLEKIRNRVKQRAEMWGIQ